MADDFDPYYKWLGIPPKDQPPHHYRLLGIEPFEPDRDVIDSAANRLMGYLKDLASGDDALYSQKLLNEISRARLCLLNADKKAAYDSELRARLAADQAYPTNGGPETGPPPQDARAPQPPAPQPPAVLTIEPPRIDVGAASVSASRGITPPPRNRRGPPARRRPEVADLDEGGEVESPARGRRGPVYALAAGLAAVGLVVVMIAALGRPRGDVARQPDSSPDASPGQTTPRSSDPPPILTLILTDDERREITLFLLDDEPQPLPPAGEFSLDPGRHRLILRRPGYQEVFENFSLVRGVHREYRPRWRRDVPEHAPPQAAEPDQAAHERKGRRFKIPRSDQPPPDPRSRHETLDLPNPPTEAERRTVAANGFLSGFGRMVAHWPFDGDATDRSGHGRDGTLLGSDEFIAGRVDRALQLSPDTQFLLGGPILTRATEFSVGLWLNLSRLPAEDGALISGQRIALFVQSGFPRLELDGRKPLPGPETDEATGGLRRIDLTTSLNSWVHLGFAYSARYRQTHYYFNGEHRGCQQYDAAAPVYWDATRITGVAGALDDLRVFNYRLASVDFAALVDGSFVPCAAPRREPDGKLVCEVWQGVALDTPLTQIGAVLRRQPDASGPIAESLSCDVPAVSGDNLACIQGFLYPTASGNYPLSLEADGRAILYIQGTGVADDSLVQIAANQPRQGPTSASVTLTAGKPVFFRILVFGKADSGRAVRLGWQPPDSSERVEAIPAAHFGSYRAVP